MIRTTNTVSLAAGLGLALAGCAVGPNYQQPAAPHTDGYLRGGLPAPTASAPLAGGEAQRFISDLDIPGQWWTLYRSPQLNALIEQALAHNPTLESAQAALRQANETVAAQRGGLWPSVSGSFQAERQKSNGASFGLPQLGSTLYSVNTAELSVSYTLDLFGGVRRQIEALQAQSDYQRYALEASYLSLTANIVTTAVNEASLRAQIEATQQIIQSQQAELDITRNRVNAGGASLGDVLQQQTNLQATLASLPALRSQLAQARNQLAAYLGDLPADYDGAAFSLDSLTLPTELPVSLPSKLVEQRPDIREYAALLHQATAQIGVATANMLPQITLSGTYGGTGLKASQIFSSSSVIYSLIGGVTQPIFKGGQLVHQRRADVAAAQEAAANYRSTVLTAFQNVADALSVLQSDADALAAQTTAEETAARSLKLVQAQYVSGAASHLQVLTAEQSYQQALVSLVKARAQRFADTAALFQALGGGWWNRNDLAVNSNEKGSP